MLDGDVCVQALNFFSFDMYSKALGGIMSDGNNSTRFLAGALAGGQCFVVGFRAPPLWWADGVVGFRISPRGYDIILADLELQQIGWFPQ